MTDKLTELKSKLQEATDLVKEYELLEEARRRGFVEGARYKSVKGNPYTIGHVLYVSDYATLKGNIYSKNIDGNTEPGLIYRAKTNQWAEIIPEEEKKEELILLERVHNKFVGDNFKALKELVDKHNADKPEISDYELQQIDRHIKKIDQSLHDQIREGGWEKVMELYCPSSPETLVTDYMFTIPDEAYFKINAFYRLLALSKVLNEGEG